MGIKKQDELWKEHNYKHEFCERLKGKVEPVISGHGSIDLIVPGCHKASGLKRLVKRWGISPSQCAAFGDGGNDMILKCCNTADMVLQWKMRPKM